MMVHFRKVAEQGDHNEVDDRCWDLGPDQEYRDPLPNADEVCEGEIPALLECYPQPVVAAVDLSAIIAHQAGAIQRGPRSVGLDRHAGEVSLELWKLVHGRQRRIQRAPAVVLVLQIHEELRAREARRGSVVTPVLAVRDDVLLDTHVVVVKRQLRHSVHKLIYDGRLHNLADCHRHHLAWLEDPNDRSILVEENGPYSPHGIICDLC
mmetsp:Transcript_27997/g.79817  ORF Transcript_27997/g.79817 Transcript_27997/m.79817 type:complete len:208 (-) Transcript_27997:646-1269(-)